MTLRQQLVEWQVCGLCNYACSYCIQRADRRVGHPSSEETDRLLHFLGGLQGRWEIKMSGGEPFAFRGFLERIVPGLIERTPHLVSTLTNLSAPPANLARFAELTRGRLGIISASLHLEYVNATTFVARAVELRQAIDPRARLVVNAVLVPGRLPEIAAARDRVVDAGLPFFPQLMKVGSGMHQYRGADLDWVQRLVGCAPTPRTANVSPSYRGHLCHAGAEYIVLDQRGNAWSCRAARRQGEGFLGNAISDRVHLRDGPATCAYDRCPCTTPANRGLVEGVSESGPPRGGPPKALGTGPSTGGP